VKSSIALKAHDVRMRAGRLGKVDAGWVTLEGGVHGQRHASAFAQVAGIPAVLALSSELEVVTPMRELRGSRRAPS
jgi:hypothetical protein